MSTQAIRALALFVAGLWACAAIVWAMAWPIAAPDRTTCTHALVAAVYKAPPTRADHVTVTTPRECRGYSRDQLQGIVASLQLEVPAAPVPSTVTQPPATTPTTRSPRPRPKRSPSPSPSPSRSRSASPSPSPSASVSASPSAEQSL